MINCSNCQAPNEVGATFCDQCGTQLASAPPVPPSPPAVGGNSCPQCSSTVIPGEMFCDNCGAQLNSGAASPMASQSPAAPPISPPVAPPPNIPPPVSVSPPAPVPPAPVSSVPAPQPPTPPAISAQLTANNGEVFSLSGKTVYVLGREDDISGIYPEVDTTGSGGDEGGVSRRHAQIVQQGNQWFIEDLNSTNGTQVNNQRLASGSRQALNPGDQIRLGTWQAKFG